MHAVHLLGSHYVHQRDVGETVRRGNKHRRDDVDVNPAWLREWNDRYSTIDGMR